MVNHRALQKSSTLSDIRAVGSVADGATLERMASMDLAALCDVVELRVDAWPDRAEEGVSQARLSPVPVLVTVRRPGEGGQNDLPAAERIRLAGMFLPVAEFLDVEIASMDEMAGLVADARAAGVIVVASSHDFSATPPVEELRQKREAAMAAGADVVKFATTLRSTADIATLAALLEEPGHPPTSVMGMGRQGRVSRLLLAQLGSVLNYGYLDRATVPGQWPAARLRELIREL